MARGVAYQLRDAGHAVDLIGDGVAADVFLSQEGADLIVLDINLPGLDGLTVLRRIRERGDATPVILLTARSDTGDRVAGLDAGADDYLIKPFEMAELEARIRALSRRRPTAEISRVAIGSLEFDPQSRQLFHDGHSLDIPRREIAVLECLLESRDRLVPKASILDRVYGIGSEVEETVIEVHISRLRKRLAAHGVTIKNARGLGYLLEDDRRG
ncbi:MAG: response regulator transcription factor [Proteobacteria bacterium]|nr:response regulator transcription factor [Pseudomonadota bacterium]